MQVKAIPNNMDKTVTVHFNTQSGPASLTTGNEMIMADTETTINVVFPGFDRDGGRFFVPVKRDNPQIVLYGLDDVSSIAYRFHLARQGDGHVDLRFCTGQKHMQDLEHDNARTGYARYPGVPRSFS